jgi:transposase
MADNGHLTVDQKVKVVLFYAETKSVVETQRRFHAHIGTKRAPCKQTIYRLCQQFQTNGSVLEKKRLRPTSVHTPAKL